MTLNINQLSTTLENIVKNTDFSVVESATTDAINRFEATRLF